MKYILGLTTTFLLSGCSFENASIQTGLTVADTREAVSYCPTSTIDSAKVVEIKSKRVSICEVGYTFCSRSQSRIKETRIYLVECSPDLQIEKTIEKIHNP